jgi:hypothetical protein
MSSFLDDEGKRLPSDCPPLEWVIGGGNRQKDELVRVHVLYKRPEIPANKVVPGIAVSVTYSKQEKAANTGSTPVSATKTI